MKNSERFNNAIDALVTGFFNGTLAKGNCAACAVGNIVAKGLGGKVTKDKGGFECSVANRGWTSVFMSHSDGTQTVTPYYYILDSKIQIDSTGYDWMELAKVESAFEKNTKILFTVYYKCSKEQIMADQYSGLMAVVDVLCEIEGIEEAQEIKEAFSYETN